MRQALAALAAQIGAETRTRLRSTGTIFTVLVLFAAAFAYIPPPNGRRVSIMWESAGEQVSGTYSAGFVGAVVGMLTAMLLPLVGFYLVTGSVRRDLERRVWPIVAATPTSAASYLLGKWVASVAYLLVLASLALVPAAVIFAQHGTGPFSLVDLLLPWLLMAPPAMMFTAAMALLFDVTPGLRGRGGYVVWFFAFGFLFMAIPGMFGRIMDPDPTNDRLTSYDPSGLVLFDRLLDRSMPEPVGSISMGVVILDEPVRRVAFPRLRLDGELVVTRLASAAWSAAPLLAAIGMFSLTRRLAAPGGRRRERKAAVATAVAGGEVMATALPPATLHPRPTRPSAGRSIVAELILIWTAASWLKWPLLLSAVASLALPGDARAAAMAAFLLLLAPPLAEVAAREALAGTAPVTFAQPGVPRSVVAWKAAAVLLFVALVGLPVVLGAVLRSAAHGGAMALALLFVAGAAVGLGYLTGGGKLFLGAYTALWYMAIQNGSPLDFSGAFAGPDLGKGGLFVAVAAVALVAAAAVERGRRLTG
jgi:hypothetical protein